MGRYHPSVHDSSIKCDEQRCGVRNAPEGTDEYDPSCWRCGEPLDGRPEVGDIVDVDIVDLNDEGKSVAKTEGGFVLFLNKELASLEASVEVTSVEGTAGEASVIE